MLTRWIFALALALLLSLGSTVEAAKAKGTLSKQARAACLASGGYVRRGGLIGYEGCVYPFADAGKVCRDGADCLSKRCYWRAPDAPGSQRRPGRDEAVVGHCAANDDDFGCWELVKDGKWVGGLCVD